MSQWIDVEIPSRLAAIAEEVLAQTEPSLNPKAAWRPLRAVGVLMVEPSSLLVSLGGALHRVASDGALIGRWETEPGESWAPLGLLADGSSLWTRPNGAQVEVRRFDDRAATPFADLHCEGEPPARSELRGLALDPAGSPHLVGSIDAGAAAHLDTFLPVATAHRIDLSTSTFTFVAKAHELRPGPSFFAVSCHGSTSEFGGRSPIDDGALLPSATTTPGRVTLVPSRAGLPLQEAALEFPVEGAHDARRLRRLSLINGAQHPRTKSLLALAITRPTHLRIAWR